ncbi:hypothetical protein B0H17DRAFT_1177757 [Mycena rosella]|uniref:Uncharacterized protein n=1 Tax=Mycena rosella TaxID=1033263 RepID=A0AAD7GN80_MYCRO|nr:hypothetical protein B0H17DRAFT_1177757 [Mycena rosella]
MTVKEKTGKQHQGARRKYTTKRDVHHLGEFRHGICRDPVKEKTEPPQSSIGCLSITILFVPFAFVLGNVLVSAASTELTRRTSPSGTYFPPSTYQTFDDGVDHPLSRRDGSLADSATAFVETQLKVNASSVKFKSGYSGDVAQYAYVKQQHSQSNSRSQNNISFANAVANIAFKDGMVVSFGNSFVNTSTIAPSTPTIAVETAISAAEQALDGTYNNIPTTLEYLVQPDNSVSLIYVVQVQNPEKKTWPCPPIRPDKVQAYGYKARAGASSANASNSPESTWRHKSIASARIFSGGHVTPAILSGARILASFRSTCKPAGARAGITGCPVDGGGSHERTRGVAELKDNLRRLEELATLSGLEELRQLESLRGKGGQEQQGRQGRKRKIVGG